MFMVLENITVDPTYCYACVPHLLKILYGLPGIIMDSSRTHKGSIRVHPIILKTIMLWPILEL